MFVVGLERMYPGFSRSDVACFRVSRVPEVFAIPTLGYSTRVPPMATSVPGVHLVTSAQIVNGTLNVNETVGLAERAARSLLGDARASERRSSGSARPASRRRRIGRRPVATLSLDLDNLWSYLKTRGDRSWRSLPSFLRSRGTACPAIPRGARASRSPGSWWGRTRRVAENRSWLSSIAMRGSRNREPLVPS